MAAEADERALGELRWITVRGPAADAFAALGEHMRAEIGAVLDGPETERLREYAAGHSELLESVRAASAARFPRAWAELASLAAGAKVPPGDLALVNLRGDLGMFASAGAGEGAAGAGEGAAAEVGVAGAGEGPGSGCSDLAWRRGRSFIGHNEDEPAEFIGRCALVTFDLDGEQPVTAYWVPGFLPANAFSVSATGLVISVDHLPVREPAVAPGRNFVARGLQSRAATVGEAIEFLRRHPSAGGFSYTIGDPAGRVAIVESAAGQTAVHEVGDLAWHTNHGRFVTNAEANPRGTSLRRGGVLGALAAPDTEPDHDWFLSVLAGNHGVRADPDGQTSAATVCTFVVDLTAGDITIKPRGAPPARMTLAQLAAR